MNEFGPKMNKTALIIYICACVHVPRKALWRTKREKNGCRVENS